MGTIGKLVEK